MARTFAAGSSDVVTVGGLSVPTVITVAALVNITAYRVGDEYRLLTTTPLAVYQGASNKIGFYVPGWSTAGEWSVVGPSTGAWAHVAVTYDGSSASNNPVIYIAGSPGSLTTVTSPAGTYTLGSSTAYLGCNNLGTRGFGGGIAELGVWNRALSVDEIAALAKGFTPSFFPQGLVLYTPLSGRESPEPNYATGAGSYGTVTGTTYLEHPPTIYPAQYFYHKSGSAPPPLTIIRGCGRGVIRGIGRGL